MGDIINSAWSAGYNAGVNENDKRIAELEAEVERLKAENKKLRYENQMFKEQFAKAITFWKEFDV